MVFVNKKQYNKAKMNVKKRLTRRLAKELDRAIEWYKDVELGFDMACSHEAAHAVQEADEALEDCIDSSPWDEYTVNFDTPEEYDQWVEQVIEAFERWNMEDVRRNVYILGDVKKEQIRYGACGYYCGYLYRFHDYMRPWDSF